jgi:dTDP-4-amino-4,6-dideoxygalactose transaminase
VKLDHQVSIRSRDYEAHVQFVEDKLPDWARVQQLMEFSARAGRWANFGPVQRYFTELVAKTLDLGSSRTVVSASSATSALFAIVGAHAADAGRPLVWAISAYGFYSTAIGPLAAHVRVVDCDHKGMIDVSALSALPADSWDGLIATDLFGAQFDFSEASAICRAAGKPLIIDSAVSFPTRRSPAVCASEIVSFHHTKPWGFGEGGCAIVDVALAEKIRSFENFGVGAPPSFGGFAANGKMSDIAAALIVERLERMPSWADGYRRQRERLTDLALSEGLDVLTRPPPDVVVPHVPLLAPRAVDMTDIPSASFAVAKYYRPLGKNCPVATDLHARMVNVPCHPGMASIDDAVMRQFFRALAEYDVRQIEGTP